MSEQFIVWGTIAVLCFTVAAVALHDIAPIVKLLSRWISFSSQVTIVSAVAGALEAWLNGSFVLWLLGGFLWGAIQVIDWRLR